MSNLSESIRPYVRKRYYIKKDFQKRLISEHILLTLLGFAMANWILYVLLKREFEQAIYKAHIGITSTADVVLSPLFLASVIVVIVSGAAIFVFTAFNSWKVARRLHCLAEGIGGLKNLDLTVQVTSCHGDRLTTEVAEIFNTAVGRLNKKMGPIKSGIANLEEAALHLDTENADAVNQFIMKVKNIEDQISSFKLRQPEITK